MSLRRVATAAGAAGAAIALVALGPSVAADESPSDGSDAVLIDVGTGFAPEVTVQLFDAVIVPGDDIRRSFRVRNDGPTDATMTVEIIDVTHMGELDQFFDDVTVNDTSISTLIGADNRLLEVPIALGEVVTVPLDVHFPAEATSGNYSEVGHRSASFHVRVTMRGDTPGVDCPGTAAGDARTAAPAAAAADTCPGETPTLDPVPSDEPGGDVPGSTPVGGVSGGGVAGSSVSGTGAPGGTDRAPMPVAGPRAAGPVALPQTGPDLLTTLIIAAALGGAGLVARLARRRAAGGPAGGA